MKIKVKPLVWKEDKNGDLQASTFMGLEAIIMPRTVGGRENFWTFLVGSHLWDNHFLSPAEYAQKHSSCVATLSDAQNLANQYAEYLFWCLNEGHFSINQCNKIVLHPLEWEQTETSAFDKFSTFDCWSSMMNKYDFYVRYSGQERDTFRASMHGLGVNIDIDIHSHFVFPGLEDARSACETYYRVYMKNYVLPFLEIKE